MLVTSILREAAQWVGSILLCNGKVVQGNAQLWSTMSVVSSCCLQSLQTSFQTLCSICMLPPMVLPLGASQGGPSRSPSIPCSSLLRRHSNSLSLSTGLTL